MSIENAKEFLIKTSTESEAITKAERAYLESMLKVAKAMGYEISEDELRAAMEDLSSFGELSEQELGGVVGAHRSPTDFDSLALLDIYLPQKMRRIGKFKL